MRMRFCFKKILKGLNLNKSWCFSLNSQLMALFIKNVFLIRTKPFFFLKGGSEEEQQMHALLSMCPCCVLCRAPPSPRGWKHPHPTGAFPTAGLLPPPVAFIFSLPPPPCCCLGRGCAATCRRRAGHCRALGRGGGPGLWSLWWFLRLRCPFRTAVSARGSASSSYFGLVMCSRELIRL